MSKTNLSNWTRDENSKKWFDREGKVLQEKYKPTDRVTFKDRDDVHTGRVERVWQFHLNPTVQVSIKSDRDRKTYVKNQDMIFPLDGTTLEEQQATVPEFTPKKSISVAERTKILKGMVRMIANGNAVSMIINGEGGLGKTYIVLQTLREKGMEKDQDFMHIKGFSTPRGLYNMLYDNNGKVVILDDCDDVIKNDIGKNLLKGALDSYDERQISWINAIEDGARPNQFIFTGRMIFISNMPQSKIDEALLSRAMSVDLTMTIDEKIEMMELILPSMSPEVDMGIKRECLDLINEYKYKVVNLNLRTLKKVILFRTDTDEENAGMWKEMSIYSMTNTVS